jgi:transposase
LTQNQRRSLEALIRRDTAPQRDVLRARIALAVADGRATTEIAATLEVSVPTVCKWRGRLASSGVEGLMDAARSGRPRELDDATRMELIALACEPLNNEVDGGRTTPTLDEVLERALERGIVEELSRSHLHRILQAGDVHPHRVRMWLHSPDPEFRPKVNEICELYLRPPPGAHVISIDEKTGMQAIERKHVDGDPEPGRPRRQEFEYIRHGTQALIASFNVQTGEVLAACGDTRTGDDLEAFMERQAMACPTGDVHVIWDNLNTHHAMGSRWEPFNERHGGRFHFHFTPVHASWVNQIEIWFGILGRRCLHNASFTSKAALRAAVERFARKWNTKPHPFRWKFGGYPLQSGAAQ